MRITLETSGGNDCPNVEISIVSETDAERAILHLLGQYPRAKIKTHRAYRYEDTKADRLTLVPFKLKGKGDGYKPPVMPV